MRKLALLGGAVIMTAASLTIALPASAATTDVNAARCAAQGGVYTAIPDGSVRTCVVTSTGAVVKGVQEGGPIALNTIYWVSTFDATTTTTTTTTTTGGAKPKTTTVSSTQLVPIPSTEICTLHEPQSDINGGYVLDANGNIIYDVVDIDIRTCASYGLYAPMTVTS